MLVTGLETEISLSLKRLKIRIFEKNKLRKILKANKYKTKKLAITIAEPIIMNGIEIHEIEVAFE